MPPFNPLSGNPLSGFSLGRAVLVAALAGAAVPAHAEDLQWMGNAHASGAELFYGQPETDHVVIAFVCNREAQQIDIVFPVFDVPVGEGETVPLTLSSEAGELVLDATATHLELDDRIDLTATLAAGEEIALLLDGGGMLTVAAAGREESVPLEGAVAAAVPLFEACPPVVVSPPADQD